MTAHRCQGATIVGTAILHVGSAFAPAIVYVMLSRATKRSNVLIVGALAPEHFTPVSERAFAGGDNDEGDEGDEGEQSKDGAAQGGEGGDGDDEGDGD